VISGAENSTVLINWGNHQLEMNGQTYLYDRVQANAFTNVSYGFHTGRYSPDDPWM